MKVDVIGDIHGCYSEFVKLVEQLGYQFKSGIPVHTENRKLAFVGDLTDRGPESLRVVRVVCDLVQAKEAYYVPGNHCNKLYRYFLGRNVQVTHGLETTVAELEQLPRKEQKKISNDFINLYEGTQLYHVLDDNKLIIAHAGIRKDFIGKYDKRVKTFVLYGDITGKSNQDGTPERRDWAKQYTGDAWIVYGHTPVKKPRTVNHTINIDTGAVFGGNLTAFRYPEMTTVSIPSSMPYVEEKFRSFDQD